MKCISCGAEIGLTDKICPHCGRMITETAGHQADMEFHRKDSAGTKNKVRAILSENVPMVISSIVMILLVIAVSVASHVKDRAFMFREDAARRDSVKQYETYSAIIQDYLDAGDYTGFAAFEEYHSIAEWEEPYSDLQLLCDMAKEYSSLVSAVENAAMHGPDARWYNPESYIRDCRHEIWDFNFTFENARSKIDEDPYKDYIYDMKKKADMIMEVYLGLDEAGREEYFAASDIWQEAYLEEVLLHD
ncbi:MAG: zinc ribbon domain-containing protein, partial [Lachnospiraceae bacterium]|nr:zinc ribbon domain-containing protein [Lachnospiraceae bacterium]